MSTHKDFFGFEKPDEDISKTITSQHNEWKKYELNVVKEYYMLFNNIIDYLPFMGPASRLYIFYCIVSKNQTGESWYSIDSLANKLHVSVRTINTWNDRLNLLGLVARKQGNWKSAHTFLLPTRDYVDNRYSEDFRSNSLDLPTLLDKVGKIYDSMDFHNLNVYHLFQWRKDKQTNKYTEPYNSMVIALSRKNSYLEESLQIKSPEEQEKFENATTRRTFIYVELPKTDNNFISISENADDFLRENIQHKKFQSPITPDLFSQLEKRPENILGLAVTTSFDLKAYTTSSKYSKDYVDFLTQLDSNVTQVIKKTKEVGLIKEGDKNE